MTRLNELSYLEVGRHLRLGGGKQMYCVIEMRRKALGQREIGIVEFPSTKERRVEIRIEPRDKREVRFLD